MILSTTDKGIYHYMEGMSAPMGVYQTYPWAASGVLLVDKTIREGKRGQYRTDFRAPPAGRYTVPFLVSGSPQLYGCFDLTIEGLLDTTSKKVQPLELEPLFTEEKLVAGAPVPFRIRLRDPETRDPVDDLEDLVVLVSNGPAWSFRAAAKPQGDGCYEIQVNFPRGGSYSVLVACGTRGVAFGELPAPRARVEEAEADTDPVGSREADPTRSDGHGVAKGKES